MEISFTYLGMIVGENPRKYNFWMLLLNKLKYEIIKMKRKVCLLKIIIVALQLLYLSFFKLLVSIGNTIIRLQIIFFCGDEGVGEE